MSNQFSDVKVSEGLEWNQGLINYIEGLNMLFCAKAITLSAQARPVSVGSHFRTDTRRQSSEQVYSLTCRLQQGDIKLGKIQRQASPRLERIKANAGRLVRLNMLKVINRLPDGLRDKVLVKAWRKNAGAILDAINKEAAA